MAVLKAESHAYIISPPVKLITKQARHAPQVLERIIPVSQPLLNEEAQGDRLREDWSHRHHE